jgi:hypothetical protein
MIREATDQERLDLLDGCEGFVADVQGEIVGQIAWMLLHGYTKGKPEFYVHNFESRSADPLIAARLWKAIDRKRRDMGFDSALGNWMADGPMTRLLDSSRVEIASYMVRLKGRN